LFPYRNINAASSEAFHLLLHGDVVPAPRFTSVLGTECLYPLMRNLLSKQDVGTPNRKSLK